MAAIIKTVNLTKKFKDFTAVDGVNLEIEEDECFGLLGPNGAGKTSLIRMLIAVSPPASGDIYIQGKDLKTYDREIKSVIGIVPQADNLDPDLTVMENLMVFSRYFDIPRNEAKKRASEVLQLFELQGKIKSKPMELSGGMKRRLMIARSLINKPKILILDEPTVGLDPQSKYLVWGKLTEFKMQGVTQLLCTQNMEEAATLSDRVAVMNQGKILSLDTPVRLIEKYVGSEVTEIWVDVTEKATTMKELQKRGLEFEDAGLKLHAFRLNGDSLQGLEHLKVRKRPSTLEDVFFRLTGRSLVE